MTKAEVISRINESLVSEFELEPEQMLPQAHLHDDLGLDSLDRVDMVIILEKSFNFKIREEETIREIVTLGQIHDYVLDKLRSMN